MTASPLHQLVTLAAPVAFSATGGVHAHQLTLLAATVGQAASRAQTTQLNLLASTNSNVAEGVSRGVPELHQLPVLVAFKTGIASDPNFRSWAWNLDGHVFYNLVLGDEGSFVFGLSTGRWSQFVTEGYPVWNAEAGIVRRGQVLAADVLNPIIWEVTPDVATDEGFKPIRRVVTAISPVRGRDGVGVGEIIVYASADTQQPGDVPPTMTLSYSDDQGASFETFATYEITGDSEYSFRSLGSMYAPGRVWRIEDVGGPVRISDAWIDVEGDENG